ncbi:MAG TPA: hypothetical protein VGO55_12800 [Allosphingosinicella sp.]|jgi:hypothetical protein|nr:hypothetical protein [Allosphingosinicella sp.]
MNMLLLAAALLSTAPAAAPGPPYFYCKVSRTIPFGNVTVLQYVNTAGVSEPARTSWFAERGPDRTLLMAIWSDRAEMRDTVRGADIFIGYRPSGPTAQYRVEVARAGAAAGDPVLRSELHVASANGFVSLRTYWGPVTALLADGTDLEVRILDARGTLVLRDWIGAAEFGRSLRIAGEIQSGTAVTVTQLSLGGSPSPRPG